MKVRGKPGNLCIQLKEVKVMIQILQKDLGEEITRKKRNSEIPHVTMYIENGVIRPGNFEKLIPLTDKSASESPAALQQTHAGILFHDILKKKSRIVTVRLETRYL